MLKTMGEEKLEPNVQHYNAACQPLCSERGEGGGRERERGSLPPPLPSRKNEREREGEHVLLHLDLGESPNFAVEGFACCLHFVPQKAQFVPQAA